MTLSIHYNLPVYPGALGHYRKILLVLASFGF